MTDQAPHGVNGWYVILETASPPSFQLWLVAIADRHKAEAKAVDAPGSLPNAMVKSKSATPSVLVAYGLSAGDAKQHV